MDFSFSQEQIQIADQARRFLERECPMEYVRAMFENDRGFTDEVWAKMAEMGWMAMRVPEDYDGLGLELVDLVVVLEEMGRALLPGPFFSTVMLAAECLIEGGSPEQKSDYLPGLAAGQKRGTLALLEPEGGADPAYIQMKARQDGDGFILQGTKIFVPDAHTSDFLVCAARTDAAEDPTRGITLFLLDSDTDGVSTTLLPTMDGTRKLCVVELRGVRVAGDSILGELHKGWETLVRVMGRAQVGLCADAVGGARKAMEIAAEYAKIRVQFDQPIGAFQAIKHSCSQMFVEVESARSILYWAAWVQDHCDAREAELAASVAKAYCCEVYRNASSSAIQVLGGTGFTWEHDIHLYLKRAKGNQVTMGDQAYHRERIARFLEEWK